MKIEIIFDEKVIVDNIVNELKGKLLRSDTQNPVVIHYEAKNDELLTVTEVSKALKSNKSYVYKLINTGLLPALKLGSLKVRSSDLNKFLDKHVGYDLTDLDNIKPLKP